MCIKHAKLSCQINGKRKKLQSQLSFVFINTHIIYLMCSKLKTEKISNRFHHMLLSILHQCVWVQFKSYQVLWGIFKIENERYPPYVFPHTSRTAERVI